MQIDKVLKVFKDKANKKFIISSHKNLEGDALGSQLALYELLKAMGKKITLLSPEEVPDSYSFLPGVDLIRYRPHLSEIDYDVACMVDCTGIDRIGMVQYALDKAKPIVNIDHHVSNSRFGTVNWVAPDISCSGEQIYHLFKRAKLPINKRTALYMYVAMVTDTGSFRYTNTNAGTHRIVSELIGKGLNPTAIYRKIYEESNKSRIALLASALSTLDMTADGKIAWIRITKDMLKKHKTGMEGTEDFVNFPRSIRGVKVALAFREVGPDMVKVSFRSNDRVDVSRLAKIFGGGGHPSASGCTLTGTMGEAEEAVVLKAKEIV